MAALLFAVGCVEGPVNQGGFRDQDVTLAGTTRFDGTKFEGVWVEHSCIGPCRAAGQYIDVRDGVVMRMNGTQPTLYGIDDPGVLRGEGETLVVMWVDTGFRTAAIGDAKGTWAAILNRGKAAADRVRAATEVLDFNGWDISQLREVSG